MRLLFVTWDGPEVNYLESLFLPIFRGLQRHGVHTDVLQFRWGDPAQERAIRSACAEAGIGYSSIRVHRWGGALGPFVSALLGGRQVRKAVRRYCSDVIMPRSVLPSLAVLAGRGPQLRSVLLDADGLELDERVDFGRMKSTSLTYRLLRDAEAQMVRKATAAIVRTEATRGILVARAGPPTDAGKFSIVTNGRDGAVFHPQDDERRRAVRSRLEVAPDAPLLVYVGSLGWRYRTGAIAELALELRKHRRDTRLLVLTGRPEVAASELLAAFPDLEQFTMVMRASPDEVPAFLAAADAGTSFIHQSFSTAGISPVKNGEYLLCGVPIVGTGAIGDNAAAMAEGVFLDDSAGAGQAAEWIAKTVLPNREDFRHRARQIGLQHYSLARTIEDYLAAITKLQRLCPPNSLGNIPRDTRSGMPASRA